MNQSPAYADLEIRILKQDEQGYPVELSLDGVQQFRRTYLRPGILPWILGASPAEDGERLFNHLFADDQFRQSWAEIRGQHPQRRVRLRIDADAPELHTIPWELLRDTSLEGAPQTLAAATATPFSRYLAGRWQPGEPILERPVKICVAIAGPDNLADYELAAIDLEAERAALEAATAALEVELLYVPQPCTPSAIEAGLRQGCHIFHFIGHGQFGRRREEARLYLADEQNQVSLATEQEFVAMIARQFGQGQVSHPLRLIFLASCQTATRSPADAFRGLAPQLIAAGVPVVLAMQDLIPINTAQAFSRIFYRQLLAHGLVDLATNEARASLLTAALSGSSTPVLFSRLPQNRLLALREPVREMDDPLAAYRAWLEGETADVSLRGIPLPGRLERLTVPLDQIYIKLQAVEEKRGREEREEEISTVMQEAIKKEAAPQRDGRGARLNPLRQLAEYFYRQGETYRSDRRPDPVDPETALKEHRQLVILGAPGSGKSTLLRYLARQWARHNAGTVPILVPLRDYATALSREPTLSIRRFALDYSAPDDRGLRQALAARMDEEEVIWLLDALDETRGWGEEVVKKIRGLSGQIVVTSRPVGYPAGLSQFTHFEILPLALGDVDSFLQNWFSLIAEQDSQGGAWVEERVAGLKAQLEARPRLKPLLRNPLLLTFLAGLGSGEPLPENRTAFYETYIEKLLKSRELARSPARGAEGRPQFYLADIQGDEARAIVVRGLHYLGWRLHLSYFGGKLEDEPAEVTLVTALTDYLQQLRPKDDEAKNKERAEAILEFWQGAGLIDSWNFEGKTYLAFRHLIFQEYAVAEYLHQMWQLNADDTWRFLRPRLHLPVWREPILMFPGLLKNQADRDRFLDRLLKGASPYERVLRRDLRLAALLLGEGIPFADDLVHRTVQKLRWLIRPHLGKRILLNNALYLIISLGGGWLTFSLWGLWGLIGSLLVWSILWVWAIGAISSKESFRFLRRPLQILRFSWLPLYGFNRTFFVTVLGQITHEKAVEALIDTLADPGYLYGDRLKDEFDGIRRNAVEALGQLGDARAVEPLIAALNDEDRSVRDSAVEALDRLGGDRGREGLIIALENTHRGVRERAAEALVQLGDVRGVAELIVALERGEEEIWKAWAAPYGFYDPGIGNERAIEALVQLGGEQAVQALITVLEKGGKNAGGATGDSIRADIRKRTAEALGRLGDARAIEPLIARVNDSYPAVREKAIEALGRLGGGRAVESVEGLVLAILRAYSTSSDEVNLAVEALAQLESLKLKGLEKQPRLSEVFEALAQLGDADTVERVITLLIATLEDENGYQRERERAVWILGLLGDERAVEPLIAALNNTDRDIRMAVARTLGVLGNEKAVKPLIAALGDGNWSAADALGQLRAIEPLIAALKDTDSDVRQSAATALGKLGDERAIKPLIAALDDEGMFVPEYAVEALAQLGGVQGVEGLIVALGNKNERVRGRAAEALGRLGGERAIEPLIAALSDEDEFVRKHAIEALGRLGGERVIEPLTASLDDEGVFVPQDSDRWRFKSRRNFVKKRTQGSTSWVFNGWCVGEIAAETLVQLLEDERGVEGVIAALEDEHGFVRQNAVKALGRLGGERVLESLIAVLDDEDKSVRQNVIEVLGQLGDARAIKPLTAALGDANSGVRLSIVGALMQLGNAQVIEPLIAVLDDEDKFVRQRTIAALGQLGNVRAIKPLTAALGDADSDVRRSVVEALEQLGDARAIEPALRDKASDVRKDAIKALGRLGDVQAVEPLITILKDTDSDVRRSVIEALGQLGKVKAVEPLIATLEDADKDIRRSAVKALGQLGDARAIEPLIKALGDEGYFISVEALKILITNLDRPDECKSAAHLLQQRLTDKEGIAKVAWELLEQTANRLDQLTVKNQPITDILL